MMKKLISVVTILALGVIATVVFAQRPGTNTAPATRRYLPEYTKEGDLILPKNWRSTVGAGVLPWGLQRRRRDRQGFEAVRADRQHLGILQLQSSRAESPDRQAAAEE